MSDWRIFDTVKDVLVELRISQDINTDSSPLIEQLLRAIRAWRPGKALQKPCASREEDYLKQSSAEIIGAALLLFKGQSGISRQEIEAVNDVITSLEKLRVVQRAQSDLSRNKSFTGQNPEAVPGWQEGRLVEEGCLREPSTTDHGQPNDIKSLPSRSLMMPDTGADKGNPLPCTENKIPETSATAQSEVQRQAAYLAPKATFPSRPRKRRASSGSPRPAKGGHIRNPLLVIDDSPPRQKRTRNRLPRGTDVETSIGIHNTIAQFDEWVAEDDDLRREVPLER
ncbi:MAG: hypothetical protein M1830_010089 [Pleopsidium flavum]|nr:MAG: hypothetical protein M1830_010089 [Pleopsidium flavum]